ncbi:MAG: DUF5677 domain-containing protein [Candidatus Margulisiibacteriota bacterium]
MFETIEREINQLSKENLALLKTMKPGTTRIGADAFYTCTKEYFVFIRKYIIPILMSQLKLKDKEKILLGLYLRMVSRLDAVIELNNIKYYETIASNCRTIFEILVDSKLLWLNMINDDTNKYFQYVDAKKYEYAKKYINGVDPKTATIINEDFISEAKKYVANKNESADYKILYKRLWGMASLPDTWTGKKIFGNADLVGMAEDYRYLYARLCWDTHSGLTGVLAFDKNYYIASFGISHLYIEKYISLITDIIIECFHLSSVIPKLKILLQELSQIPGAVILKSQLDQLKKSTNI